MWTNSVSSAIASGSYSTNFGLSFITANPGYYVDVNAKWYQSIECPLGFYTTSASSSTWTQVIAG